MVDKDNSMELAQTILAAVAETNFSLAWARGLAKHAKLSNDQIKELARITPFSHSDLRGLFPKPDPFFTKLIGMVTKEIRRSPTFDLMPPGDRDEGNPDRYHKSELHPEYTILMEGHGPSEEDALGADVFELEIRTRRPQNYARVQMVDQGGGERIAMPVTFTLILKEKIRD